MMQFKVVNKFNGRPVRQAVDREGIRGLYRAGGYMRTTVTRSIRRGKNASAPGSPPRTRRGGLKKAIAFSVNRAEKTVVVGPRRTAVEIGSLHEFGGKRKIKPRKWDLKRGGVGPIDLRKGTIKTRSGAATSDHVTMIVGPINTTAQLRRSRRLARKEELYLRGRKPARYPARPYMAPALKEVVPKLPSHMRINLN